MLQLGPPKDRNDHASAAITDNPVFPSGYSMVSGVTQIEPVDFPVWYTTGPFRLPRAKPSASAWGPRRDLRDASSGHFLVFRHGGNL